MDVQTCIKSRFSTRLYRNEPISNDILFDILGAARYAPSPKNRQPWRFAILRGDEKALVVRHCREELLRHPIEGEYLMRKEPATEAHTFDVMEKAPVLILVFNAFPSEDALNCYNPYFDASNIQAIGAAIENILLRAAELGVGSLWVGDILTDDRFLTKRYFDTGRLVAGIVLGFSGHPATSPERRPLSELIVFNGGEV